MVFHSPKSNVTDLASFVRVEPGVKTLRFQALLAELDRNVPVGLWDSLINIPASDGREEDPKIPRYMPIDVMPPRAKLSRDVGEPATVKWVGMGKREKGKRHEKARLLS